MPEGMARLCNDARRPKTRFYVALSVEHCTSCPRRHGVLLLPVDDLWQTLEAGLAAFEPGFVLKREQPPDQQRAEIDVAGQR